MKGILTIISRTLKDQLRSPLFWLILVAFPIAELFLFKGVFLNQETTATQTIIKVSQLYPADNSFSFLRLAINVLGQFFLISSVVASSYLLKEKEDKTLMRTMTYPLKKSQIFLGHLISLVIQLMLVIILILVLISFVFNVQWATNYLSLFFVTFLCVFLCASFGLLISLIFKNSNMASGLMSGVVILMSFLNGDMTAGKLLFKNSDLITLNKWITSSYIKLSKGLSFNKLLTDIGIITFLGLSFTILAIVLFRRETSYE